MSETPPLKPFLVPRYISMFKYVIIPYLETILGIDEKVWSQSQQRG